MVGEERGYVNNLTSNSSKENCIPGIHKNIEQSNNIEETEQLELGRITSVVYGNEHHAFDILDKGFDEIQVLVVGFGLTVLQHIKTEQVLDLGTEL